MPSYNELDIYYENKVVDLLKEMPWYCIQYFNTMVDKTDGTKLSYIRKINSFLKFLEEETYIDIYDIDEFTNVKPSMISNYINNKINAAASCKATHYYAIKNFFDFLCMDDHIDKNPCDKVPAPIDKVEHKITYLTKEEIDMVMHNIEVGVGTPNAIRMQKAWKIRNKAIISLALSTGLRSSSIRSLNVIDHDSIERTIRVYEKGNKERYIKISEELNSLLNEWEKDRTDKIIANLDKDVDVSPALFISSRFKRLSATSFRHLIDLFTYNIDKKITPHKLRSTYATHAIKKTHDIYLVAHQLGHSDVRNTARYAAIDEEMEEQAASVMDDILF